MENSTIGHYRVEAKLGSGGMGTVYRGLDIRLGRPVAMKFLREEFLERPEALERFNQEAQAISALNHPNICTLYDVGSDDGRPYLVMEFLEGETVNERLARKPFTIVELIEIGTQTADALDVAHSRGLIHRDIKPSNIFLLPRGQAKLLDFGIAKVIKAVSSLRAQASGEDTPTSTMTAHRLTAAGTVTGTVAYMSPEQVRGEEVDARSDVFSLGATLYEMAAGKPAFSGRNSAEIAACVLERQPVPLGNIRTDIPAALSNIVATALEKDKQIRYQSAAELRAALLRCGREISGEAALRASPATRARRRTRLAITAAVGLCAVAASIFLYRRIELDRLPRFQHIEMRRLTADGTAVSAAVSPDGRFLAYSTGHEGLHSFRIRQIAGNSELQAAPPSATEYRNLVFSPDGNQLYYGTGPAGLYAIPTLGGSPKLVNGNVDSPVAFSPDGSQIAFYRRNPGLKAYFIIVARADGTGERKVASREEPAYFTPAVAWSPDGKTLAFGAGAWGPKGQYTAIVAIPASGGTEQVITGKTWRFVSTAKWMSHGHGLMVIGDNEAFSPTQVWYLPYPRGKAERITNDLNYYTGLSVTADSSAFATVQLEKSSNLWVADSASHGDGVQITSGGARIDGMHGLAWTPDGRIVYTSKAGGEAGIWIAQPDGNGARQIIADGRQSRVSPDGKYVVFSSDRGAGKPHIWRADLNGDHPTQLTNGDGEHSPECCLDGKTVVYSSLGGKGDQLWGIPLEGGPPAPVVKMYARVPIVSPDSLLVAFNYFGLPDPPRRGVAVVRGHGGTIENRFAIGNADPTDLHVGFRPMGWRPDSRAIQFLRDTNGVSNLWEQPLDGGPATQISHFTSGRIYSFAWSRDGRRMALAKGTLSSDVILIRNSK